MLYIRWSLAKFLIIQTTGVCLGLKRTTGVHVVLKWIPGVLLNPNGQLTNTRYPFQLSRISLLSLNYIFMANHCGIHKVSSISLYYLPYTNKTAVDALIYKIMFHFYYIWYLSFLTRLYLYTICHHNVCSTFRSRWLWSRLMPQSSYAPVKGLYLYGGVGTGKTMLMDLFFDQL